MASYYFKRKVENLNRSSGKIFGPLKDDGTPPKGHIAQKLDFTLSGGTVARCDLEPGKRYDVVLDMFGKRGGSLTATIQPTDLSRPFEKAFKAEIPANLPGDPTLWGYHYIDIPRFTVKGGDS